MKLPRWLVACLIGLSVLVLLTTAVWWWSVWPEWTMRRFAEIASEGRLEECNQMMKPLARWVVGEQSLSLVTGTQVRQLPLSGEDQPSLLPKLPTALHSTTLFDRLIGLRRATSLDGAFEFTAQFGKVSVRVDEGGFRRLLHRERFQELQAAERALESRMRELEEQLEESRAADRAHSASRRNVESTDSLD